METLLENEGCVQFLIEWTNVTDYIADFNVWEVVSYCGENFKEIAETELYLKGSVKWDGCSHFWFGNEGYMHLCGKNCWERHVQVMNTLWEVVSKKIVKFDFEVAR